MELGTLHLQTVSKASCMLASATICGLRPAVNCVSRLNVPTGVPAQTEVQPAFLGNFQGCQCQRAHFVTLVAVLPTEELVTCLGHKLLSARS